MSTQTIAIQGYDPVNYFTNKKATLGDSEINHQWNDSAWHFISDKNRDLFRQNPERYAPVFNSECSFAKSLGKSDCPESSPKLFAIRDEKLFLFSNPVAALLWKQFKAPAGKLKSLFINLVVIVAITLLSAIAFANVDLPGENKVGHSNELTWFSPVVTDSQGVAIQGFDTVAYFNQSTAVKGLETHSTSWNGVTWYFASVQNKTLFEENPEAYAPQFGGNCSFAASTGQTVSGSPEVWSIVDDRLFFNANPVAKVLFRIIPNTSDNAYNYWSSLI